MGIDRKGFAPQTGLGQQFECGFDDIGNRTQTKAGGDQNGANLRTNTYTPNKLNQYTSRTVAGAVDVMGAALVGATVTVNGPTPAAYRKGEYIRKQLTVANTSAPVWQQVEVTATGETPVTRHELVPRTPEAFTPDTDGNLLTDGRWTYTWDAENRLVKVESLTTNPTASKRRVTWEYDSQGRRIRQTTYDGSSGSYAVTEDLKLVYDGWACVAELNYADNALKRSYGWGTDLSGSLGGAGGVGGLLLVNSTASGAHFYAYDGNGNVTALVKATDATVSANYEYGPFGEPIRATGTLAKENAFRFSTKRTDNTTDLVLYEYRLYNPNTGRWLSRDPIDEAGFELGFIKQSALPADTGEEIGSEPIAGQPIQGNLYCFVSNEPVSAKDALGLWQLRCRPLAGIGGATGQRHCWIECGGHSYSLLNNNGTATKIIDDPRDKGKGTVVEQGPGKCKCIAWQFKWNADSFPYDKDQCNSNHFAHSILDCCGLSPSRPARAWGWGDCNDSNRRVQCVCYSGIVN